MKPSEKMLELLKKANEEYLRVIADCEEDYVILNTYLNLLCTLTRKYLEYKRKGM